MQRWQGAALAVALCSGCLDAMVDDEPGYSRLVVPQGTAVASAYDDPLLARKIDTNDGLGMGPIPIKTGYAAGSEVRYWDLGPARRAAPAYVLLSCVGGNQTPLQHPPIFESIPGEGDYSPFRAIYPTCVTERYAGQLITSVAALEDAIELELLLEPSPATSWRNWPVVNRNVDLSLGSTARRAGEAYYEGKVVLFHQFADQEGEFTSPTMIPAGYAYEIVRADAPNSVVRTIFSSAYRAPDGTRNPGYSPQWTPVTVLLKPTDPSAPMERQKEDLEISSWTRDTDVVAYTGANNAPVKKEGSRVASITVASPTARVNRPFLINEVVP
jgi:hypothetical protein